MTNIVHWEKRIQTVLEWEVKVPPLELPSLFLSLCEPATHHMRMHTHTHTHTHTHRVPFPRHEHININSLAWVECLFNKSCVLGFF